MTLINNKQQYMNDFNQLNSNEKELLIKWIKNNLIKRKTINNTISSYGLKHYFEKEKNAFYITNNQFKGAMIFCDYIIKDVDELNWHFNISIKNSIKNKEGV